MPITTATPPKAPKFVDTDDTLLFTVVILKFNDDIQDDNDL